MHRVIVKRPNENPEIEIVKEIELEYLQNKVGGLIDVVRLPGSIDLIVNDESLLHDNPTINFRLEVEEHLTTHNIYDTVVFTSFNEYGDSIGLTDNQIAILARMFGTPIMKATMIR